MGLYITKEKKQKTKVSIGVLSNTVSYFPHPSIPPTLFSVDYVGGTSMTTLSNAFSSSMGCSEASLRLPGGGSRLSKLYTDDSLTKTGMYKIGDTFKITDIRYCGTAGLCDASHLRITGFYGASSWEYDLLTDDLSTVGNCGGCYGPRCVGSSIELIGDTTPEGTQMLNPMSALANLVQRTLNPNTKTLYRAGYLDTNLNVTSKLTSAALEMFVAHIIDDDLGTQSFKTFADELIKRATEEIAEEEKKSK